MSVFILYDFVTDRSNKFYFTDIEMETINRVWTRPDSLLADLQHTEMFAGKFSWSELKPSDYKFLVLTTVMKFSKLGTDVQENEEDVTRRTLLFLLGGFKKCIEEHTSSTLEYLKMDFMVGNKIVYDMCLNSNLFIEGKEEMPNNIIKVIFDKDATS